MAQSASHERESESDSYLLTPSSRSRMFPMTRSWGGGWLFGLDTALNGSNFTLKKLPIFQELLNHFVYISHTPVTRSPDPESGSGIVISWRAERIGGAWHVTWLELCQFLKINLPSCKKRNCEPGEQFVFQFHFWLIRSQFCFQFHKVCLKWARNWNCDSFGIGLVVT